MKGTFSVLIGGGEGLGSSIAAGMHKALHMELKKGGYSFSAYAKLGFPVWDAKKGKHVISFLFDGPDSEWGELKAYAKNMQGHSWAGRQVSKRTVGW